ncbi:hypothetical protein [Photobacterium sp. OFAV2-7]|uniref:hypothetical protein n=1 Tax=Photobacterium sp. OFAV2-7 TaxID=2917748 RepID=UPI001EF46FCD|nr:hypothetical protein [Photobacterium sp. OFAV2-7]MCG7586817.1 hypothetical protein [Photobacterium sp. OFAV2-7]
MTLRNIILCFLIFLSPYTHALSVSIDGDYKEWTSLHNPNNKQFSQVYNTQEYLYVSYLNENDTSLIPIVSNDITFFIKNTNFTSYISFGRSIVKNSDNNHESTSHLKITLDNGVPSFKYLKPINSGYLSDIKYKTSKVNGKTFTEIAIPKRLFGKSVLSETASIVNVYSGMKLPSGSGQSVAKSSLIEGISDFTDVTITVGISVSVAGTNVAAGLAGDDYGLGGYFDVTGGDADFGISLDMGVFQGNVTDLEGTTAGASVPARGVGIKYESPTSGSPYGQGLTVSVGIKGGYSKIPDMQLTYGTAGYFVTDDDILDAIGYFTGSDSTSNDNNDNDWDPNNDSWGHDDDHGPSYGSDDSKDWSHDDDDNSGYF